MTISSDDKPKYRVEIIVALGYVLFALLAVAVCLGSFYLAFIHTQGSQDPIIASLDAPTPTAQIPADYQTGANSIFQDDFRNNRNDWINAQEPTQLTVKDGKLSFGSATRDHFATALPGPPEFIGRPYYIHADLSPDQMTNQDFGIIFDEHYGANQEFFLFEINPESKEYFLYHHLVDRWSVRMMGTADGIHSLPGVNTLGIYVNKGYLEFYINRKMVDTYQDSGISFQAGETGFYVNNSGFQLIVTDFSIDKVGGQ